MKYLRQIVQRLASDKAGAVLILALIFIAVGALMLPPLLSYMGTALKHTTVYQARSMHLYAADAGVVDAKWKIKYDKMGGFSPYDFLNSYDYRLEDDVNNSPVDVSIKNVWIPTAGAAETSNPLNSPPSDPSAARRLITGEGGNPPKLLISSRVVANYLDADHPGAIEIKVQYYPEEGDDLRIKKLGAWVPGGFNLRPDLGSDINSYAGGPPTVEEHASGQAVIWDFADYPFLGDSARGLDPFPGGAGAPLSLSGSPPLVSKIVLKYENAEGKGSPESLAWIETNQDLSGGGNLNYTWDGSLQIYRVTAVADGQTRVETYVPKTELKAMHSAYSGDYIAAGNSLMVDTYSDGNGIRDTLLTSSSSSVNSIPADAEVSAAYLYWSAWRDGRPTFFDDGSDASDWIPGSAWIVSDGLFRSQSSGGAQQTRYLTLKTSLDLSACPSGSVVISWDQSVAGNPGANDVLYFSFSTDNGSSWSQDYKAFQGNIGSVPTKYTYTLPDQYLKANFLFRFSFSGFTAPGQSIALDNIYLGVLLADRAVTFQIDGQQVYFDGEGQPEQGAGDLAASRSQVLTNYSDGQPHGYSYSSFRDVTDLVRAFSAKSPDPAANHPGNATYTLGGLTADTGDNWSYAGWSILIIYSSPATAGHQLYLYDKFLYSDHYSDIDFDGDGKYGGTISGFLVPDRIAGDPDPDAARLTCFVGEGDQVWDGDFLAFNAPESYWATAASDHSSIPNSYKLWDGTTGSSNSASDPNNVWNGKSLGTSADGVDIDTFHVPWQSIQNPNGLAPGDSAAHIDIHTGLDIWNVVYVILSFRSAGTTGNSLNYYVN